MVYTGMGHLYVIFFKGSLPIFADELPTVIGYYIFWDTVIGEIIRG